MSVIRKLLIQGIRSFDPQNQDIIEFYTPLTIIVGQNGCGKTTIIECLKYITTGELPPNSKGGAFIHDPKLAGENEVKAQVKLRFNNVSQRSMTCVRSMLLVQKKATVTQRTLEGALSFDATSSEDKVSISSRCADLDAMLPDQLGVSKAVLENVIFCHQEESNWPLSEPSILKKKFDEIFAATRYTKALESIKTIRKNQSVDIRVARGELKHLEEKKTKAERVRTEYEKSTAAIHRYQTKIADIKSQEVQVTQQIESLAEQIQEFLSLRSKVEGLQMSLEQKVASYKELEANTAVLSISDEDLERLKADTQNKIASQDSDLKHKREERDRLQGKLQELQNQISDMLSEIGRLQAAQDNLNKQIANRSAAIAEICAIYTFTVDMAKDDTLQVRECANKIEAQLDSAENERKSIKRDAEAKESLILSEIEATQTQINSFNNTGTLCENQISANNAETEDLKRKHQALQVDEAHTKDLEGQLALEKEALARAQEEDIEKEYEDKSKQKRFELAGIVDEINRLNSEMSSNNKQLSTRTALAAKRSELESKDARWKELKDDAELLAFAPNSQLDGSQAKRTVQITDAIEAKQKAITSTSEKLKASRAELSSIEVRLGMAKQSFDRQTGEMAEKRERISKVCDGEPFDEAYADAQTDLHELMELAGHYKSASSMYKAYIQKIESEHACPVCHRGWDNKDDELKLVSKLKLDYTSAPAELLKVESDIKESERRVGELSGLQSIVRDVKVWDNEDRSHLESQIKQLADKAEVLREDVENMDIEVSVLETELEHLKALKAKSEEFSVLDEARKELCNQISIYEHELRATGSIKTMDELQKEITSLQAQASAVRHEQDRLSQGYILKQKELGARQDKIRSLQDKLSEYGRQSIESQAILKRIADLEAINIDSERRAKEARDKASSLNPQLASGQARLAAFRSEVKDQESKVDQRVRNLNQSKDRLAMLSREIEHTRTLLVCPASEQRYPDQLARASAEKAKLQQSSLQVQSELDAAQASLRDTDKIITQLAAKQREISDNIRLRTNLVEQGRIKEELQAVIDKQSQLETQLSAIDEEAADGDDDLEILALDSDEEADDVSRKRKHSDDAHSQGSNKRRSGTRLQRRRDILNSRLSQLTSERAGLQGEVKQLEDQAKRLMHELSSDYKDIDVLYVKQLVQCKTEELANADLEKYGKALDSAIMRYHSLKMQDINKIIRELWINTYQGNDIDTIEIRSEMEGSRNSRSHNYRVVMIKGGHAINMRGRCSAGQKVLACLIIRLALAETFSVNCGILALDEPTTNLDQENIDSLARSLARIIKSRQGQRNFQLIVITHDEIFMQLLGKSEYADYYWRVYKDASQCSVFARRPISNN